MAKYNLEDEFRKANVTIHMAGAGSVTKAVEEAVKATESAKAASSVTKATKKALPKMKATEAVDLPYTTKEFNAEVKKFSKQIAKDKPKLSEEEVLKAASFQADKKLKWQNVQKPALESSYGALEDAPYSASNPEKMRSTPEVVQERINKAQRFLAQPTEAWQPPPERLWAFDRNAIKDALEGFPDVEQSRFPRDIPARANVDYVSDLYTDPVNRELIIQQIKRGLPLGGETFYASLYPVKQAVLEAGGTAADFERWIHSIAPASARNSILNEMAVGQFLRDMNAKGIELTEENVGKAMQAFKEENKIGLPLMKVHREGVEKVLGGIDLREHSLANIPTNYKIPTYGTQKAGDFGKSVVLDVHESAGETLGSQYHPYFTEQGGFKGGEYGAGEAGMLDIADELGIPGGMAQAGRWFGGGELTGLRSPRGDALDLLEKQAAYTLLQRGVQPNPANVRAEILNQIMTGEGTLLPWFKKEAMPDVRTTGLQKAEGGEINLEEEFIKADMIPHMAGGGKAKKTDYQSIQEMAADPTAYFWNEIPEMPAAEPTLKDKAKALGKTAKQSLEKEFQSYKLPHAGTDVVNDWIANFAGAPVDLVNMMLTPVGLGTKEPFLGSQQIKHKMRDYGMHTGTERPWSEVGTSFVMPQQAVKGAVRGVEKAAELTKDIPVGLSIKDVSQGVQFTSPLEKTVNSHKMETMPGNQWSAWLSANAPKGAKKEAEASRLNDWLKTQPKVSKADITAFLDGNRPQVRAVEKGAPLKLTQDEMDELHGLNQKLTANLHGLNEPMTEEEMNRVMYLQNIAEKAKPGSLRAQAIDWEREARKAQKIGNKETANYAFSYAEHLSNRADMLELNPLDFGGSKFESYTLPGGKNYKETMLTLPKAKAQEGLPAGFEIRVGQDQKGQTYYQATTPNTIGAKQTDRALAEEDLNRWAANTRQAEADASNYRVPSYHGYEDPDADINRVAHIRTNERSTADSKRALFLEELQSDWAQKGRSQGFKRDLTEAEQARLSEIDEQRKQLTLELRDLADKYKGDAKGYNNRYDEIQSELAKAETEKFKLNAISSNTTPTGPYVTDTKDWTTLGLKHALKQAVDEGHDYLAWTTGQQQADRYNLAQYLDNIRASKNPDGTYNFLAYEKYTGKDEMPTINQAPTISQKGLTENELSEHLGKEMANKIVGDLAEAKPTQIANYNNLDLAIGGEGMKGFYDQIIPQVMNDLLKQYGIKDGVKPVGIHFGNKDDYDFNHWKNSDGTESVEVNGTVHNFKYGQDADKFLESLFAPSQQMGIEITPELREKVLNEGLTHFKRGGKVKPVDLETQFRLADILTR